MQSSWLSSVKSSDRVRSLVDLLGVRVGVEHVIDVEVGVEFDLEQPPVTIGILVDRLGGVQDRLVDPGDHPRRPGT